MATTLIEVRVPDIGDYKDVEVIDVAVQPGNNIALEATLVTLETEKATMDVPATVAGVIRELKIQRGARVSKGDVIALVEVVTSPASAGEVGHRPGEGVEPSPQPSPARAGEGVEPSPQPSPARAGEGVVERDFGFSRSHATPSIRRLARELGVDLVKVQGTGAKGRVLDADVKSYVKSILSRSPEPVGAALPRIPEVDFSAFGTIERRPLTRIQKISGPRLHASWVNIPHVTQFDEADITEMEEARARMKPEATVRGVKLTPLAFVMRACVQALQTYPTFCASLDAAAGELVLKKYVHIGFAADTPGGLVVPVVRDADRMDVFALAGALATLSQRARAGKLSAAEMQGGCFTISSLGGIGGTAFTPVINAPEVAILGVSRSVHRPVYRNGSFVPRLMLPLSLSYDHRIIDGAAAARFTSFLAQALADVPALLRANP